MKMTGLSLHSDEWIEQRNVVVCLSMQLVNAQNTI